MPCEPATIHVGDAVERLLTAPALPSPSVAVDKTRVRVRE